MQVNKNNNGSDKLLKVNLKKGTIIKLKGLPVSLVDDVVIEINENNFDIVQKFIDQEVEDKKNDEFYQILLETAWGKAKQQRSEENVRLILLNIMSLGEELRRAIWWLADNSTYSELFESSQVDRLLRLENKPVNIDNDQIKFEVTTESLSSENLKSLIRNWLEVDKGLSFISEQECKENWKKFITQK